MCSGRSIGRRHVGATTVGIACNRPSLLGEQVDIEIAPLVGPEVIAGSTRLKSGTATKMVLNMITTGAMVLIGKTFGNRMIDLQPTNEKLRIRTRRILRELGGVDDERAAALLAESGGPAEAGPGDGAGRGRPGDRRPPAGRCRRPGPRARSTRPSRKARHEPAACRSVSTAAARRRRPGWPMPKGRVLGRGSAGPSNAKAIGPDRARAALGEAIGRGRSADAGLTDDRLEVACLGLAGLRSSRGPGDARIAGAEAEGWARRLVPVNDGDLVLAAGTPEGLRDRPDRRDGLDCRRPLGPEGSTARAGGWGPLIGDEGSGYACRPGRPPARRPTVRRPMAIGQPDDRLSDCALPGDGGRIAPGRSSRSSTGRAGIGPGSRGCARSSSRRPKLDPEVRARIVRSAAERTGRDGRAPSAGASAGTSRPQ